MYLSKSHPIFAIKPKLIKLKYVFSVESDAWTTTYPQIFTHSNWRFTTGKAGIQCSLVTPHVNSSCSVLGRKSDDEVFVMDNSNIDNSDITPDDNLVPQVMTTLTLTLLPGNM